jgi:hypothetical protein
VNPDDLLGTLHHDKLASLDDRLHAIDLELNHRRLIGQEHTVRILEQLEVLNAEILRLRPEGQHAIDLHHLKRAPLEREHRELELQIHEEREERWRDEQNLRREQRELRQTKQEQWQHYERNMKDYAA